MKRLLGVVICSLVMTVGLMATPAAAEPVGWNLRCIIGFDSRPDNPFYVDRPEQCHGGLVQFVSWKTGRVDASISIWAIEQRITRPSYTWTSLYNDCQRRIVCSLGIAAGEALVLSKIKGVFIALKALVGR